jgi:uncharacterized BrkB/YihY/UPF0761 family membrane protein
MPLLKEIKPINKIEPLDQSKYYAKQIIKAFIILFVILFGISIALYLSGVKSINTESIIKNPDITTFLNLVHLGLLLLVVVSLILVVLMLIYKKLRSIFRVDKI